MTAAMVTPASERFEVTFEIRLAPCAKPTMNRFGKPCTWMPCIDRMPSSQQSESRRPSRPIVS